MKIAFFLQNAKISSVDCSDPMNGNPGIGGTEYLFISTAFALARSAETESRGFEMVLLANSEIGLPEDLNIERCADQDIGIVAKSLGADIVVLRYSLDNYSISKQLNGVSKVVMWTHNFVKRSELSLLSKDKNVVAIVCVGSEQLNLYRDHNAYYKSVVIFNGYPIHHFIEKESEGIIQYSKRGHEVTYLGSLVDFKGFHLLAAAWPDVIKAVPDAHLNVIGGGKLYDRNQKLGVYGFAEERYEDSFMKYLTDENGDILHSVTFHGVLGNEKKEILKKTKVGVPNPSGVSETFCIAALELQLWGAVITTINFGGFKDTVYSTGLLYDNTKSLSDCIIKQLQSVDNKYPEFIKFAKKFDFSEIIKDWITLFSALKNDENLSNTLKPKIPQMYKKYEINRKLKRILPFGNFLPTMMLYKSVVYRIKGAFNHFK